MDLARQLNTDIPPDRDYFQGPGAPRGSLYFGVFLPACNRGGAPRTSTDRSTLVDAFGNRLKPKELSDDNVFAYEARQLAPGECIRREGSAAARAAPGAMLLVEVPLDVFSKPAAEAPHPSAGREGERQPPARRLSDRR